MGGLIKKIALSLIPQFWEPSVYKPEYMGWTCLNQVWFVTPVFGVKNCHRLKKDYLFWITSPIHLSVLEILHICDPLKTLLVNRINGNDYKWKQCLIHLWWYLQYILGCPIFTLFLNWATSLSPLRLMGCRSSQKNFSVIDQKLTLGERFSCLTPFTREKGPK